MIFQPNSITADGTPDDDGLLAMRAALRDLKVVMRKPKEHPQRAEILSILSEARTAIDRINAPRQ
jgi:hypothetical protein